MSGRALLLAVSAPVVAILVFTSSLAVVFGGGSAAACTSPAGTTQSTPAPAAGTSAGPLDGFDAKQVSNATTIVATGQRLGVPVRGWIIAVATAIQESTLRNVRHGDEAGPDSLGLFQQRNTWGSRAARLNPASASRMFYLGGAAGQPGLLDIPHWQTMPLTEVAQAVQQSADPDAYADHETEATRLVATVTGASGLDDLAGATSCTPSASGAAAQVVAFARDQLGVPYRWGGDGPSDGGFDCSGLTHAAYAAAGIQIPRTAQSQYNAGPPLPSGGDLLPGDLLFFGGGPRHVSHVGIYIGENQMIDAPHAGASVRVEDYAWADFLGSARPSQSRRPLRH